MTGAENKEQQTILSPDQAATMVFKYYWPMYKKLVSKLSNKDARRLNEAVVGYPLEVLDKNFLCTEEVIMKVTHDINKDIMLPFMFGIYQTNEHDQYHFELWNESFNKPKPLYMVWHDIMNY